MNIKKKNSSATTFHPDASATMHDILPLLEEYKKTGHIFDDVNINSDIRPSDVLQNLIRSKMKPLLKTRTLRGYPLNMPFTDIDEVLAKVIKLLIFYYYIYLCSHYQY